MEFPEWQANAFTMDMKLERPKTILSQQNMLALAYLKNVRTRVVGGGFSYMGSVDGSHRTGKSIQSALMCWLWDPTFGKYMENRIVQDHREFADCFERADKIYRSHGTTGVGIVVDEAGTSMASSDWYEKWMKALTKMTQMFGYLCPMIMFVAPVKDFLDSRLKRMFHAYYKMQRYDRTSTYMTPYHMSYNSIINKYLYRKPMINYYGREIQLRRIRMGPPPLEIIDRYHELESGRKQEMLAGFIAELKRDEVKEAKKEIDSKKLVEHVINNFKVYETKRSKDGDIILSLNSIRYGLDIAGGKAGFVKEEAERVLNRVRQERIKEVEEKLETTKKEVDRSAIKEGGDIKI